MHPYLSRTFTMLLLSMRRFSVSPYPACLTRRKPHRKSGVPKRSPPSRNARRGRRKQWYLRAQQEGREALPGPLAATVLQPEWSTAYDMAPNAPSIASDRLHGAGAVISGSALRDQQGLRGGADGTRGGVVDSGTHEADAAGLGCRRGLETDPLAARVGV